MTLRLDSVPVRKRLTVDVPIADAFAVFTEEVDSWWPRTHHIGRTPMTRIIIESRAGGRCYTEHEDGTTCDWGKVLVWDPPRRLVLAWQMTHAWQYEPDLRRSSEVDVRFTALSAEATRVDLEHRFFERHGDGGPIVRGFVDAPNGWDLVLSRYSARIAQHSSSMENP